MNEQERTMSRDGWFKLVATQETSGLTQIEFCKQHELNLGQFGYYRKIFYKKPSSSKTKSSFIPVVLDKPTKEIHEMKLELPNGCCCYVPITIPFEQLKELLVVVLSC